MDINTETEVLVERIGDVDVVTINRPEMRNALRFETYDMLEAAVRTTTARCLVITGADPAFCSGDDVRAVMGGGEAKAKPVKVAPAVDAGRRRDAAQQRAGDRRGQRRRRRLGDGAGDDGRHPRRLRAGQVR